MENIKARSTNSSKNSTYISILEKSIRSNVPEKPPVDNKIKSYAEFFEEANKYFSDDLIYFAYRI